MSRFRFTNPSVEQSISRLFISSLLPVTFLYAVHAPDNLTSLAASEEEEHLTRRDTGIPAAEVVARMFDSNKRKTAIAFITAVSIIMIINIIIINNIYIDNNSYYM